MRHVILLVLLLLGGCVMQRTTVLEQTVIHTERETTIKEDHQTTTTNHPAVPPKVIVNTVRPPVAPEQRVKMADKPCGVFVLPNAGDLPIKPDLSVAADVDKAISDYVKALRRHIDGERKSIVKAYDDHLKKCVP